MKVNGWIIATLFTLALLTSCSRQKHRIGNFTTGGPVTDGGGGGGLGDEPDDPNPGARDGTLGVLNFSNAARFYRSVLTLQKYPAQTAFNSTAAVAQGALPVTNKVTELQAPAQVMALQQLANAACRDMVAGENALPAASRTFLKGISPATGPGGVPLAALRGYFTQLSIAFTGADPSQTTLDVLTEGFREASLAAPSVPSLSNSPTLQTLAALQIACAALGSSARTVKQ